MGFAGFASPQIGAATAMLRWRPRSTHQLALFQLYIRCAYQRLLSAKHHHEVYVCPNMTVRGVYDCARPLLFRRSQPSSNGWVWRRKFTCRTRNVSRLARAARAR